MFFEKAMAIGIISLTTTTIMNTEQREIACYR